MAFNSIIKESENNVQLVPSDSWYSETDIHNFSTPTGPQFGQTQPFTQQVLQEISQRWK